MGELEELIDKIAEKIQEESLKRCPIPKSIDEMEEIDKVLERIPADSEKVEIPDDRWDRYSNYD